MEITSKEAGELYQLVSIGEMHAEERARAGEEGRLHRDLERSKEMGKRWQETAERGEKWKAKLAPLALEED